MRENPPTAGMYLVTTDRNATEYAYFDGTKWPKMTRGEVVNWQEPPKKDVGIEPEVTDE